MKRIRRPCLYWLWALTLALGLHGLGLIGMILGPLKPLAVVSPPVDVELWHVPVSSPPVEAVEAVAPAPAQAPPVAPRPARKVQTDDRLPLAAMPVPEAPPEAPMTSVPVTSAPDTAEAVTPKAYDAGGNKGRAALTQALLKREACLEQRRLGKPLDKDCALGEAPKDLVLGIRPPEKRPTRLCIAARERRWQAYRDGRAAYPGIGEALRGNKDCRKDWD